MAEDLQKSNAAMVMPDFLKDEGVEGTEHVAQEDIAIPRLALAQGLSPELQRGKPEYIPGLELGEMFNTISRERYGFGPIDFTIIRADKPRWVEFNPREEGGGVKDPNVAPGDPRTDFGPNGEKPIATKFYDFLILLLPIQGNPAERIIALSFKSTALKVGRQLNMLMVQRNKPCYSGVYSVQSVMTTNAKGTFAIYKVMNNGWITDQDLYKELKKLHDRFKNKEVQIHREPGDEALDFNTADM